LQYLNSYFAAAEKKKIVCFLLEQHPNAFAFTEINGEHWKSPLTLQAGAVLSAL